MPKEREERIADSAKRFDEFMRTIGEMTEKQWKDFIKSL